jgi:hypothetical protein
METEHPLSCLWRPFIGFALCQLAALVLMLVVSAADPKVSKDLRGPIEPEVSVDLEESYPVYVSATLI